MSYDLIVIGAGAGGLTAAYTAKGFGKNVLLIEKDKTGGECTWSGCVPSKALINIAKDFHGISKYGISLDIDKSMPMKNVQKVIANVYAGETPEKLEEDGITYVHGEAKFVDTKTVLVNNKKYVGKKIVISTGSSPFLPPIEGLDKVDYLTNESLFRLKTLPESMIILGGGPIGTEMAQALNRLGVKIHLIERGKSILQRSEPEHGLIIEEHLKSEGVNIYTHSTAKKVEKKENSILVTIEIDGLNKTVSADKLLVALGRQANITGLNLEEIGVETNPSGISVNNSLGTSVKGIYAIGDVVGPYQFSHMANVQGITAVKNAFLPINTKMDYDHVAWCTFTDPELAHAGLTESQAKEQYGANFKVYRHNYEDLDRSKTKFGSFGEVKIMLDSKGKIIGASILGDRAGELISEIQVVKTLGIKMSKLQNVIHPYPTYSGILCAISKKVAVDSILDNPIVKIFKK